MKKMLWYLSLVALTLVMLSCSNDTTAPTDLSSAELQELFSCSPETFSDFTTISYSVKAGQTVTISITNISGQIIKVLTNGETKAGNHSVIWNGTNEQGRRVASGVYIYKLDSGVYSYTKKMILIR